MAEAGSFADRVKQQADIVRVVGEYIRLKKSGQNFTGLCPFHGEKTPSFAVHPVKQIYHCFGCGKGGDVFNFVMEMEKSRSRKRCASLRKNAASPFPSRRKVRPRSAKRISNAPRSLKFTAKRKHFSSSNWSPRPKARRQSLSGRSRPERGSNFAIWHRLRPQRRGRSCCAL